MASLMDMGEMQNEASHVPRGDIGSLGVDDFGVWTGFESATNTIDLAIFYTYLKAQWQNLGRGHLFAR